MFGSNSFDESSPLLQFPGSLPERDAQILPDAYKQFCFLIGNRPTDHPANKSYYPSKDTLYHRALEHRKLQGRMYIFTSTLTNTLLLAQIILGAALTGLGASDSSRVLITVFGALNTVIAGLVAFLKSRGQPMRARMFRDDLDRVVDEIENSATMWRGISQKVHGYDAIDTDESVTVRSEVARLTRLYDRAVKTNTMNDPDFYGTGISSEGHNSALRSRTGQTLLPVVQPNLPAAGPSAPAPESSPAAPFPTADPDESPATKTPAPPPKKEEEALKDPTVDATTRAPQLAEDKGKQPEESNHADPAPAPPPETTPAPPPIDPDESPATTPRPPQASSSSGLSDSRPDLDRSKINSGANTKASRS